MTYKKSDSKMKILFFDLETSPIEGYAWKEWDTNLIEVTRDWQIICFAYKWYDKKKIHFVRPDKKDPWNDKEMIKALWDLFNEADVIVAHNLNRFDKKKSNAMFLRHGLTPPSPSQYVDTLQVSRVNFAHSSHRLDSIGKLLHIGKKLPHEGFMALYKECMLKNSRKYWAKMKAYNLKDVQLLEDLYTVLIPWVKNHPQDLNNLEGCPKCGSLNHISRGYRYTNHCKYQRRNCNDCGGWFQLRTQEKILKPKYKN